MPSSRRSSGIRRTSNGVRSNNVLLWGERGTGKSSLIKSLLTTFAGTSLRLIQVYKHDILTIGELYATIFANSACRFIIFIADLSFEEGQTDYKEIKTILDGGFEAVPENLLFYATSNRKHLIPTRFSDNESDEIRPSDTVEEKVARGALRAPPRILPFLAGYLPPDRFVLCQEVRHPDGRRAAPQSGRPVGAFGGRKKRPCRGAVHPECARSITALTVVSFPP